MITKQINKLPKSVIEVTITVPWADLADKYQAILAKLAADVELPGFRKGSAPNDLVEPKIANQIQQELIKEVMPQSLVEALQGTNIVPIDYPQYNLVSFVKGQELKFNAKITERPQISVGNYKTIKVTRPPQKQVTDEDVQKLVDDLFKRWKARQPVGQALGTSGQGSVGQNQNPPQGGAAGSMSFNPSTSSGSPAAPSTLDKPTGSVVTSNEPDDNFAKAVGAASLADLKLKIKADLEAEAKYNNELDFEEAILQEVEKLTSVEVPEVLIQDELNRMLVSLQRRITDAGMLFDDYLKSQNKTLDQIKNEWRTQAEKNVRMELGLSEIAKAEKIEISDSELQAEVDKIQDGRVKQQFQAQEPRMHLRHALRQTKTLNLLKTI